MPHLRQLTLLPLVIWGLFSLPAHAQATDICGKHLVSTCDSCHSNALPCERLGKSAKEWKEILTLMRANGAVISKEEIADMAECLSQPSSAAKASCRVK